VAMVNLVECGPKLTERDLDQVEQRIGRPLPPELREFYLQFNGGIPRPDKFRTSDGDLGEVTSFYSILGPDAGFEQAYRSFTWAGGLPAHWIPFADCMTSDPFVFDASPEHYGKIRMPMHENVGEPHYAFEVAPSLKAFVSSFVEAGT
jgi:cell wall assembly regulator SMI1